MGSQEARRSNKTEPEAGCVSVCVCVRTRVRMCTHTFRKGETVYTTGSQTGLHITCPYKLLNTDSWGPLVDQKWNLAGQGCTAGVQVESMMSFNGPWKSPLFKDSYST